MFRFYLDAYRHCISRKIDPARIKRVGLWEYRITKKSTGASHA